MQQNSVNLIQYKTQLLVAQPIETVSKHTKESITQQTASKAKANLR